MGAIHCIMYRLKLGLAKREAREEGGRKVKGSERVRGRESGCEKENRKS